MRVADEHDRLVQSHQGTVVYPAEVQEGRGKGNYGAVLLCSALLCSGVIVMLVVFNVHGASSTNTKLQQLTDGSQKEMQDTLQLRLEMESMLGHTQEDPTRTAQQSATISQLAAQVSALQQTNDQLTTQMKSRSCDLCEQTWVFVVATGRSGSTTVMEMLNEIPGFRIGGENNGAASHMYELFQTYFDQIAIKCGPGACTEAWYTPDVKKKDLLCALQQFARALVGRYPDDTKVLGWKEFRWKSKQEMDFMRLLFPCAKFVINIRKDTVAEANSAFMKDGATTPAVLDAANKMLTDWAAQQAESTTFELPLEQFSVGRFNKLLGWLDITGCTYTTVLHANANNGYSSSETDTIPKAITCTSG